MVARVSRLVMEPEQVDAWVSRMATVAAQVGTQKGFVSLTSLVDRERGECVGITMWETAEAEKASRAWPRSRAAACPRPVACPTRRRSAAFEVTHHVVA